MPRMKVCSICFAAINASNFARHLRGPHKLSAPASRGRTLSTDSVMSSRVRTESQDRASLLTAAESTVSAARPPSSMYSMDDEPPAESTITHAVNHLLEQHHIYNEDDLLLRTIRTYQNCIDVPLCLLQLPLPSTSLQSIWWPTLTRTGSWLCAIWAYSTVKCIRDKRRYWRYW